MFIHHTSPQRGQSLLEYGVIIALVISGIIVGGPLLINAVNSHFRLLDDATQDSLTETVVSTGGGDVIADVDFDCACTPWQKDESTACGDPGGCDAKSRRYTRTCPQNCDLTAKCISAPECCTPLTDTNCGTLLPAGSSSTLIECLVTRAPISPTINTAITHLPSTLIFRGTCINTENKITEQCAIGERRVRIECGKAPDDQTNTPRTFYACKEDTACLPACSLNDLATAHASNCSSNITTLQEVINRKTIYAQQKPARKVDIFTIEDLGFIVSATRLPYAFVQDASMCDPARNCEGSCKQDGSGTVYLPSSDGTSCKPAFCQRTTRSSYDLKTHEFYSTALPYQTSFSVTIRAGQHYIFTCLNKNTTIQQQLGTTQLSTDSTSCPSAQKLTLSGTPFCIMAPTASPITDDTSVTCTNPANQLYLRVWEEGSPTSPGYTNLQYEKCTSYAPSKTMPYDSNPISPCGTDMKVVTNSNTYWDSCSDSDGWSAYLPSADIGDYALGCSRGGDCRGTDCFFVYCE